MKRAWFAALTAAIVVVVAILTGTVVVRERDYQALVIQGDAALAAGQTYHAIEAFSGAIALRSESMIAYLKRGDTEWAVNIGDKPYRELLIELKDP